jgi:hypothetical protein
VERLCVIYRACHPSIHGNWYGNDINNEIVYKNILQDFDMVYAIKRIKPAMYII